ncbi:hypothetical protein IE53DRAFT_385838 [Violaceomyces palustris]|uniref:Uncharacterized protein n=1 Tax=Violaceomyces palustris TaxID=1673888 RepID=A0ACD0P199_9BASI|nr:hypothetical protein IE53DRAFT_385838 [Violaceomyces palustris]
MENEKGKGEELLESVRKYYQSGDRKMASRTPSDSVSPLNTFLTLRGRRLLNENLRNDGPSYLKDLGSVTQRRSKAATPEERDLAQARTYSAEIDQTWSPVNYHQYICSLRFLQNIHVRRELIRDCRVSLLEKGFSESDADLTVDARTGVIFFRLLLLPAAMNAYLKSEAVGEGEVGWDLFAILFSGKYDRILIILERYSTGGFLLEMVPPLQKAIDSLQRLLANDQRCFRQVAQISLADSPAHAARLARIYADELKAQALK